VLYSDFRDRARTGDLLLLEGLQIGALLIRMITGQQFSHVALLLWIEDGLWVAEMRGRGYTLTPASQRVAEMAESGKVYWGSAPPPVRSHADAVSRKALSFRGSRYSYWTLITVWIAQILRRRMPRNLVCSTLVEKVWSAAGVVFAKTPDPGDFLMQCDSTTPLQIDEKD
jgi:hypothetical protein